MNNWRELPTTQKQKDALYNMKTALGFPSELMHIFPSKRGEASKEIEKLKEQIINNLSIGGYINPEHSVYSRVFTDGELYSLDDEDE